MRSVTSILLFGIALAVVATAADAREWSDASGKFKVQGEFVAVRAGKVIIEKADGTIVSVPFARLSAADQEFVKSQDKPAAVAPAPDPAPVTAEGSALAKQAQAVLRANCYRCHGEDGASEGGFNFALNLPKLARTLVSPRNAAGSVLYERITATDDSVMPPTDETPRPAAGDIATIKAWIDAGAPGLPVEKPRDVLTPEKVAAYIAADVQKAPERSRRYLRYFTLSHLYNAGIGDDELQTYRNAFTKLINSLSWNTTLVVPETLDAARTIFRIDMRNLQWNVQMWEQVEQANPYFLPVATPEATAASEATQCRTPQIRADWFVFAASKPPLYHVMLGVPESAAELETLLRVNATANIDQEQVIRAAFNRSGVSQNNRLIEWHKSPFGSYWKSYDFGGNAGRQNLFEYPLGPGAGQNQFQHDGGELIFTLPNGLQGYLLVDANGVRIDQGPTNIVSDPKRPDKAVTNGVSCMSCHYTGVIAKADEVGPAVRANRKAFANADEILALYREPADLAGVLDEDAKRFAAAMDKLGISSLSRSGEPISAMAQRFEQELDVQLAACEFGLSTEEFLKRLDESALMSRRFAALRSAGGVIKRDVFQTDFSEAAVELKLLGEGQRAFVAIKPVSGRPATSRPEPGRRGVAQFQSVEGAAPGEVFRITELSGSVKSLAFSPDGGLLAVGKSSEPLAILDLVRHKQVDAIERSDTLRSVECSAFTPNGKRLLAGDYNGRIVVFDVSKEGKLKSIQGFAGHTREVTCITVSSDGRFALTGAQDGTVRYWEIEAGTEIAAFAGFQGAIKACRISRDGRVGKATDGGALLELTLSAKGGTKKPRQLNRSWASGAVAISHDSSLAAASDSQDLKLWNLAADKELGKIKAGESMWSMEFTPDGSKLLTGISNRVAVWDVRRLRPIHLQEIPDGSTIRCLAVSPDNQHVAAVGLRAVHIFRLPTAAP